MRDGFVEINGKEYRKYLVGDEIKFRTTCDYEKEKSKRRRVRTFVGRIKRIPLYGEDSELEIEFDDPDTKVPRMEKFLLNNEFQLMEDGDEGSGGR